MIKELFIDNFDELINTKEAVQNAREMVLQLTVMGKLVPQDSNDEPASVLLEKIKAEKVRLIKEGKIKKSEPLPPIDPEKVPFGLPKGFEWVRLGEITNYGTYDKAEPDELPESGWLLDLEDIESYTSRLLQKKSVKEVKPNSTKNKFYPNDVLFMKLRPYLNKVIIADEKGFCSSEMLPLRVYGNNIVPSYLRTYLRSPNFVQYITNKTYGMKMPRLGTNDGKKVLISLPPLQEQRRMVDKVDILMSQLDTVEEKIERSQEKRIKLNSSFIHHLIEAKNETEFQKHWTGIKNNFDVLYDNIDNVEKLKEAILQLAIMGKLVPQDPNDEPASMLLERIKAERERRIKEGKITKMSPLLPVSLHEVPYQIPENWKWVRLQEVFDVRDGTHYTPEYVKVGIPFITSKCFKNGKIDFSIAKKISQKDHNEYKKRSLVEKHDILFSMIGGNLGNMVKVKKEKEFSIKNLLLFKYYNIQLTPPDFLYLFLKHLAVDIQYKSIGGAQPFISLKFIRNYYFPIPPLKEQIRIVNRIEGLMSLFNDIIEKIEKSRKINDELLDSIKSSIFNTDFRQPYNNDN